MEAIRLNLGRPWWPWTIQPTWLPLVSMVTSQVITAAPAEGGSWDEVKFVGVNGNVCTQVPEPSQVPPGQSPERDAYTQPCPSMHWPLDSAQGPAGELQVS